MQSYPKPNPFPKKIDGIEVLKVLKTEAHLENTPVMMLSASAKAPNLTDCSKDGVNTHEVKPVDFNEFVNASRHQGFFGAAINQPPLPVAKEKL